MYDWTIENDKGEVVIGSFNAKQTKEKILERLSRYKKFLPERHYTLHLFIDETEVKVLDVETDTL